MLVTALIFFHKKRLGEFRSSYENMGKLSNENVIGRDWNSSHLVAEYRNWTTHIWIIKIITLYTTGSFVKTSTLATIRWSTRSHRYFRGRWRRMERRRKNIDIGWRSWRVRLKWYQEYRLKTLSHMFKVYLKLLL